MEKLYELLDYSIMIKKKSQIKEKLLKNSHLLEIKIAILCGSTVGEIKEFMTIFLLFYGIKPIFWEGSYNRFYEEACFPNNDLLNFAPDFIFLHMTNKNLLYQNDDLKKEYKDLVNDEKERLNLIWKSLTEKYNCEIIQNNFEYFPYRIIGNAARICEEGNVRYIDNVNSYISLHAETHKNFYVNDINYLSAYVGLLNWYDDRMWNLYKCSMAMSVMPRYALNVVNIIKSILGKNKKAVITDLDNTLWGGIIGEIGSDDILLGNTTPQGEAYTELHKYLKTLAKNGVLLNICSKNDYDKGMSGLRTYNSVLKEEDFVIKKINWNNKPENIKEILADLNILGDSVIFLDDDIVECDSVISMIPEIEVLQVGKVNELLGKMDVISYFEITKDTLEDKNRQQYYHEEVLRKNEKLHFDDYSLYLKSLNMKCQTGSILENNVQRVVQLFNKTNQFNFMTKRYTLAEILELCEDDQIESFVLKMEDKFGDNGIVAVSIVQFDRKQAHIRDWIMSCRVFERGLEYEMIKQICAVCQRRKVDVLYGYYRATSKNNKISDFYDKLQFDKEPEKNRWICRNIGDLYSLMKDKTIHLEEIP